MIDHQMIDLMYWLSNPPEWWLNLPDLVAGIILAVPVTIVLMSPVWLLVWYMHGIDNNVGDDTFSDGRDDSD
jgi:hypothetical protein